MMNFKTYFKTILTASMLFSLALIAPMVAKETKAKERDAVVGVWLYNQSVFDLQVFGVAVFNADGTIIFHQSDNLTQAIVGPNEQVLSELMTIGVGQWKKCKGKYEIISTTVNLLRGLDSSTTPCTPSTDLSVPACPTYRVKAVEKFILQANQTATSTGDVNTYEVNDLTLTKRYNVPPFNQTLTFTRVWQKLR